MDKSLSEVELLKVADLKAQLVSQRVLEASARDTIDSFEDRLQTTMEKVEELEDSLSNLVSYAYAECCTFCNHRVYVPTQHTSPNMKCKATDLHVAACGTCRLFTPLGGSDVDS